MEALLSYVLTIYHSTRLSFPEDLFNIKIATRTYKPQTTFTVHLLPDIFQRLLVSFYLLHLDLVSFYAKGPHLSLWAGSRASLRKITASGVPNDLTSSVIFIIYTQFTNVAAGRGLETCAGHHSGFIPLQ